MESLPNYAFALAFYIAAGIAVFGALMVIVSRHPAVSAVYLVLSFFAVAAVYVLLHAHFIAMAQVLVYAGAIAVLFVMVIMLMNLGPGHLRGAKVSFIKALGVAGALSILLLFLILFIGQGRHWVSPSALDPESFGTTESLAELLFTKYLLPFEITSVLLLAAIVGAIVLARRWEE